MYCNFYYILVIFPWKIVVGKSGFIFFTKSSRHCFLGAALRNEWRGLISLFHWESKFTGMATSEIQKESYVVLMPFGDSVVAKVKKSPRIAVLLYLLPKLLCDF